MAAAALAAAPAPAPFVSGEPLVVSVGYPAEAGPRELVEELIGVRRGQQFSRRAVQRSVERLFATGRYADVVVHATDVPGGVALVFDITPKRFLKHVYVDGQHVVSKDDILGASKLSEGAEYYPDRLKEAEAGVAALYERRGYYQAQVTAELAESEDGLQVTFQVTEGPPTTLSGLTFGGRPGLPVAKLSEAVGLRLGEVLDLDTLTAGLDKLRASYRAARFYKAHVAEPVIERTGTQAQVFLPTSAGAQFTIQFHGNRSFSAALLEATLNYDGTETLEPGLMAELARRVQTFYRYRGFYDARVSAHETEGPAHQRALLVFDVDEGDALFVSEVTFEGNENISTSALRDLLTDHIQARAPRASRTSRLLESPLENEPGGARPAEIEPDPATVFVDEAYLEAAQLMELAYQERGYLGVRVQMTRVEMDVRRRAASVHFDIREGRQTRVVEIRIENAPPGFPADPDLGLKVGAVLDGGAVDRARTALLRTLGKSGYFFGHVDPDVKRTEGGTRAELAFRITSGPQVHVGKVIVRGSVRTAEAFVRANLNVREGQLLDPEALVQSQKTLSTLSDFKEVSVRLLSPDTVEPVKDVVVELADAPRLSWEAGLGWTAVDGVLVQGDLTFPNISILGIGGTETNGTLRAKVSYVPSSLLVLNPGLSGTFDTSALTGLNGIGLLSNAALSHPVISAWADSGMPGRLGWRADLVFDRVFRPSYSSYNYSAITSLDWSWRRLSLTFQEQPEYDRVEAPGNIQQILPELTPADQIRLRFPVGSFYMLNEREAVTVDFRDDPANPRAGVVFTGQSEETHAFQDSTPTGPVPITTIKLQGNLTGYIPVTSRSVLALSIRAGRILLVNPDSQTIAPKRFFLGGSSTMRGFGEDAVLPEDQREQFDTEVQQCRALASRTGCSQPASLLTQGFQLPSSGGEAFELGKAELRFPSLLFTALDFGLFFEAGNLWLNPSALKLNPFQNTYRYVTGFNVRYPTPIGAIAVGLGFNLAPDVLANEQLANLNFSVGGF